MLPSENIQSIVGGTLIGADDEKLGRIDQVFVDAADGHPTWAEVHLGALRRHTAFVPLDDATWEHDEVFVPFSKEQVKNAPRLDASGGLSPAQEDELTRYYSGADARVDEDRDRDQDRDDEHPETARRHDTDDDSAPAEPGLDDDGVLWEERLVVKKERVPVAKVHLETETVTEEREVTSDVQKERVFVDEEHTEPPGEPPRDR